MQGRKRHPEGFFEDGPSKDLVARAGPLYGEILHWSSIEGGFEMT